jgi:hypothetical protein
MKCFHYNWVISLKKWLTGLKRKIKEQQIAKYTKRSVASIGLTVGEAHLAFFIFALLEFLVPVSHAI